MDVLRFALVEPVKSGCTSVFEMGWLSETTPAVRNGQRKAGRRGHYGAGFPCRILPK